MIVKAVNLHTDGSCLDNGKEYASGGYGVVVESSGEVITTRFGKLRVGSQTNNRAELEGMLCALNYIFENGKQDVAYTIYSDSATVIDGILGIARRKNNRDIWEDVENACKAINLSGFNVTVKHCNKEELSETSVIYRMNVQADLLAFRGANALIIC